MEKSPVFLGAVGKVNGAVGVSVAVDEEHSRQRKALGYLFTNRALLQFEPLLQSQLRKFVECLEMMTKNDEPIDFSQWC